jgi:protein-S-isoprenylcysteine O-methyltransferase Ste14
MRIEWIAIVLYTVWLAVEIVVLRPASDRSGSDVDAHSLLILASSNLLAPLLAIALYLVGVGDMALPFGWKLLGLLLMLAGIAVRWSGIWTLRRFFSANVAVQSDHRLVIAGPYRWVRHPGYFGGWLMFVGLAVALANWMALILVAVFTIPAFYYRIRVEEQALRGAFPEEYASYADRVRKFIPFVW